MQRSYSDAIVGQCTVGGPEVLEVIEVNAPTPGPGEVRIAGAGVNPVDAAIRADRYRCSATRRSPWAGDAAGTLDGAR